MNQRINPIALLVATILVVVGFRLASQAGQGLGVIQNDGYAGSGGFLILIGGTIAGIAIGLAYKQKGKK